MPPTSKKGVLAQNNLHFKKDAYTQTHITFESKYIQTKSFHSSIKSAKSVEIQTYFNIQCCNKL